MIREEDNCHTATYNFKMAKSNNPSGKLYNLWLFSVIDIGQHNGS